MASLLKRFVLIFIKRFSQTVLHDGYGRAVEVSSVIIALILGAVKQYHEAIFTIVCGLGITATYHAFKSAHTLCAEVAAQIREHKYQVESTYIYTPSGKPASLQVSAPVAPHRYHAILYGAACAVSLLCIFAGFLAWQWSHKAVSQEPVVKLPAPAPPDEEQTLKVFVPILTNYFQFVVSTT